MFILIALGIVYFIGMTVCLYFFAKNETNPTDGDEGWIFGPAIFWPVWVPLVVVFYLPVMILLAAIELGKQHRKGDKK